MTIEDISIPELEELPDIEPARRPWTDHEKDVIKKYFGRKSTEAIAIYLDRTVGAVENMARIMGVHKYRGKE